jgi:hypothetical protein
MGLSCAGLLLLPLSSVMPRSPEELAPVLSDPSPIDSSIVELDQSPEGADVVGDSFVLNLDLCVLGATRGTGADFLEGAELLYECCDCGLFVPCLDRRL